MSIVRCLILLVFCSSATAGDVIISSLKKDNCIPAGQWRLMQGMDYRPELPAERIYTVWKHNGENGCARMSYRGAYSGHKYWLTDMLGSANYTGLSNVDAYWMYGVSSYLPRNSHFFATSKDVVRNGESRKQLAIGCVLNTEDASQLNILYGNMNCNAGYVFSPQWGDLPRLPLEVKIDTHPPYYEGEPDHVGGGVALSVIYRRVTPGRVEYIDQVILLYAFRSDNHIRPERYVGEDPASGRLHFKGHVSEEARFLTMLEGSATTGYARNTKEYDGRWHDQKFHFTLTKEGFKELLESDGITSPVEEWEVIAVFVLNELQEQGSAMFAGSFTGLEVRSTDDGEDPYDYTWQGGSEDFSLDFDF